MPWIHVASFGICQVQILKIACRCSVTVCIESLFLRDEILETEHRIDIVLSEVPVVGGDDVVSLVQLPVVIVIRIVVSIPIVYTGHIVGVEVFVLAVLVVPTSAELQVQIFHQMCRKGLCHGVFVGIVVSVQGILVGQHVGIARSAHTNQPFAVLILATEGGRQREHPAEIAGCIGIAYQTVPRVVRIVQWRIGGQPRFDFVVRIEGEGETLVPVVGSIAFRIVETYRGIVRTFLVTSCEINRVILAECRRVDICVFQHEFLEDKFVAIHRVYHGFPTLVEQEC